jgi:NAD(P)-dependent dehydrogenase (short-subunit alcohol dehydrogenase family)
MLTILFKSVKFMLMNGKIVFITGATSGIGKATALALAKKGAEVHIHGRNEPLALEVKKEIDAIAGNQKCNYFIADLSSQAAIRRMVQTIETKLTSLDVLINNAGGVFQNFELSEDGIEKTIAVNHFAFFQLSHLLIPLLKHSKEGRIVNVASRSNFYGKIDLPSFTQDKGYHIIKAYSQSKLANVFFTQAMAKKLQGQGITVNCLHPGVVRTNIGNKGTGKLSSFVWNLMANIRGISVEEGAATSIYLASSSEVKSITGAYFDKCKAVAPNKICKDTQLEEALWNRTMELCPI